MEDSLLTPRSIEKDWNSIGALVNSQGSGTKVGIALIELGSAITRYYQVNVMILYKF